MYVVGMVVGCRVVRVLLVLVIMGAVMWDLVVGVVLEHRLLVVEVLGPSASLQAHGGS